MAGALGARRPVGAVARPGSGDAPGEHRALPGASRGAGCRGTRSSARVGADVRPDAALPRLTDPTPLRPTNLPGRTLGSPLPRSASHDRVPRVPRAGRASEHLGISPRPFSRRRPRPLPGELGPRGSVYDVSEGSDPRRGRLPDRRLPHGCTRSGPGAVGADLGLDFAHRSPQPPRPVLRGRPPLFEGARGTPCRVVLLRCRRHADEQRDGPAERPRGRHREHLPDEGPLLK